MRSKRSKKFGYLYAHGDFELLKLLPGARAEISIKGLCRVIEQPSGKPYLDMVDRKWAHREVAEGQLNRERRGHWYEAYDYETGKKLVFDNRGLSSDPMERYLQLNWQDYYGDSRKMQRRIYFPAQGFKLGRLSRRKELAPPAPSTVQIIGSKKRTTKHRLRVAG